MGLFTRTSWRSVLLVAASRYRSFSPFGPTADTPQKPAESPATEAANFTGQWQTSFGVLTLKQTGDKVEGEYDNPHGTVIGTVSGGKLTFAYQEASIGGEGWFELASGGRKFTGKWRPAARPAGPTGPVNAWRRRQRALPVSGRRPTGAMRLREGPDGSVRGCYSFGGRADVTGTVKEGVLSFSYEQPDGEKGKGTFRLADDGKSFAGDWSGAAAKGGPAGGGKWTGKRIEAQKGKVWLVVLEAPSGAQPGGERVFVRPDAADVLRPRAERAGAAPDHPIGVGSSPPVGRDDLSRRAGRALLFVTRHARGPDRRRQDGRTGCARRRPGDHADLKLLHFGSCLVAGGDFPEKFRQSLTNAGSDASFPLSGFKFPADWGGSAVIDFTYLDLIFSHGLPPAQAAEQTRRMMSFAGEEAKPGDAIPPAGLVEFEPVEK